MRDFSSRAELCKCRCKTGEWLCVTKGKGLPGEYNGTQNGKRVKCVSKEGLQKWHKEEV